MVICIKQKPNTATDTGRPLLRIGRETQKQFITRMCIWRDLGKSVLSTVYCF